MGCVESTEALSTETEDEKPPEAKPAAPAVAEEKGKRKKKLSLKNRRDAGKKKETVTEAENSKQRSNNTKITVIWRRYSAFSSRRESNRSDRIPEVEAAGPSQNPADASQGEPSDA